MSLERAVEEEYRPRMLAEFAARSGSGGRDRTQAAAPTCPHCGQSMRRKDSGPVSWLARSGRLQTRVTRYRCAPGRVQRRLRGWIGWASGRISGSLARLLARLAVVAPYPLAARLAWLLLGVSASPRGVWRAAQRVGRAAASYSEGLSAYHADSRSLDYQGAL